MDFTEWMEKLKSFLEPLHDACMMGSPADTLAARCFLTQFAGVCFTGEDKSGLSDAETKVDRLLVCLTGILLTARDNPAFADIILYELSHAGGIVEHIMEIAPGIGDVS